MGSFIPLMKENYGKNYSNILLKVILDKFKTKNDILKRVMLRIINLSIKYKFI